MKPGESLIIAANPSAFHARYTTDKPIYGPFLYGSQLANNGESIRLLNADNEIVFSVNYDDRAPWPEQADGAGYALSLRNPQPNLDLNSASLWTAIQVDNVNHPATDPSPDQRLKDWLSIHFTEAEALSPALAALNADPDRDGMNNLSEFFHGTHPRNSNPPDRQLKLVKASDSPQTEPHLEFTYQQSLPSIWWTLETSDNLLHWSSMAVPESTEVISNPDQTLTLRAPIQTNSQQRFFRLRITPPPTSE